MSTNHKMHTEDKAEKDVNERHLSFSPDVIPDTEAHEATDREKTASERLLPKLDVTAACPPLPEIVVSLLTSASRQAGDMTQRHQSPDQHSLQERWLETENGDMTHEKSHSSDSDSYSVSGKRNRRFRCKEQVLERGKDLMYWEKRRRNNEAARRSREKRRMHDQELAGRIVHLEDDNISLRRELVTLKKAFNIHDGDVGEEDGTMVPDFAAPRTVCISSPVINHSQSNHQNAHKGGVNNSTCHFPYGSPPPLLALAETIPMGTTAHSIGSCDSEYQHSSSRASFLGRFSCAVTPPLSFATEHIQNHDQGILSQYLRHQAYPMIKQEVMEESEMQFRERSNSSSESSHNHCLNPSQEPTSRRNSIGSYSHFRYPTTEVTHYSCFDLRKDHANHANQKQHVYDSHSQFQCSPVSSHTSDDVYDEPLHLTAHHGKGASKDSNSPAEENNRDCDSNPGVREKLVTLGSPPLSSYPHKLRYKLASNDMAYPAVLFPEVLPPASAWTKLCPNQTFKNDVMGLSNAPLPQTAPLSLVVEERHASSHASCTFNKNGSRSSPRNLKSSDPSYQERRRKNNEAARKCRENRRTLTKLREAKSNYLEIENQELRVELTNLQEEMKHLRELIDKKQIEGSFKNEPIAES